MSNESIERFQCQLCGRGSLLTEAEARGRAAGVTRQWYADGKATARPATRSELEDLITAALLRVGSAPSLSDAIKEVEKIRDEWLPAANTVDNEDLAHARGLVDASEEILKRLKALGPQGEDNK